MFTSIIIGVLAGLLIAGAAGGSPVDVIEDSIDAYKKSIKRVIEDDERKDQALAEIETTRKELKDQVAQVSEATTAYVKVDNKFESTHSQYLVALDEFLGTWEQFDRWTIDKHFLIQKYFTGDEWPRAMEKVNKNTKDLLKDVNKVVAKLEKKRSKHIAKYEEKYGRKYVSPVE